LTTVWDYYIIPYITERINNMEQLIYELSFFGMIVILIGLRLWGDSK
jgi:hypothetical protein